MFITSGEVFETVKSGRCGSLENTLAVEPKSDKRAARFVPNYRFHNCPHFLQRSELRDLSLENVKNVVRYPDSKRKLKKRPLHGGHVCMFEKTVDGVTLKEGRSRNQRQRFLAHYVL
jgi:hypothetical protein